MFCTRDSVERDQGSEQKGFDSSLAIDQVGSEDDQLALGAFHDLVLLSVEVVLTIDYQKHGVLYRR